MTIVIIALIIDIICLVGLCIINPYLGFTRDFIITIVIAAILWFTIGDHFNGIWVIHTTDHLGVIDHIEVATVLVCIAPGLIISLIWSFFEEGPPELWKKWRK